MIAFAQHLKCGKNPSQTLCSIKFILGPEPQAGMVAGS